MLRFVQKLSKINSMENPKQQIVEKLQSANNILVTVSSNPSVDQLAACIGLTLLLNKLDKHATAVFSGEIPSTIEFLKPSDTIEKNTDSLRDFIIALDKAKADKLRYKVEDKVVRIFITPYRTSLTADDLNFSQGDFNVDVVLALGVHNQSDLDQAITSHGRILHDATVMCINTATGGELGSLNWVEPNASSLSELASELAASFEKPLLDEQIATALLTGIVAETDRFRNDKTSATTMSVSADLMKAGANQQLVASELDHEVALRAETKASSNQTDASTSSKADTKDTPPQKPDDGTLEIKHGDASPEVSAPADEPAIELPSVDAAAITNADETKSDPEPDTDEHDAKRTLVTEPPTFGGQLTANSTAEDSGLHNVNMMSGGNSDHSTDGPSFDAPKTHLEPLEQPKPAPKPAPSLFAPPQTEANPAPPVIEPSPKPSQQPVWQPPSMSPPKSPASQPSEPTPPPQPASPVLPPTPQFEPPKPVTPPSAPEHHETLTELEETVDSPHVTRAAESAADLEKARQEVLRALNEQPTGNLPPVEALNAHSVDLGHAPEESQPPMPPAPPGQQPLPPLPPQQPEQPPLAASPADRPLDMPLPPSISVPPAQSQPPTNAPGVNPNAPPPVPPPMVPPHFGG
jgi:hypothetical protein